MMCDEGRRHATTAGDSPCDVRPRHRVKTIICIIYLYSCEVAERPCGIVEMLELVAPQVRRRSSRSCTVRVPKKLGHAGLVTFVRRRSKRSALLPCSPPARSPGAQAERWS